MWESDRVDEGSATVALRMAEELGDRVRLAEPVRRVAVVPGGVAVTVADGEELRASAAVCALPVGPLRDVELVGLDPERERSLRAQRSCLAAKVAIAYERPFWRDVGRNGLSDERALLRLHLAAARGHPVAARAARAPRRLRRRAARREPRDGAATRSPRCTATRRARRSRTSRACGGSTRSRAATSPPGRRATSCAVGPRHGTHAPPIWFCGSDQWVAGYMEGAVRTGRAAAASLLARR